MRIILTEKNGSGGLGALSCVQRSYRVLSRDLQGSSSLKSSEEFVHELLRVQMSRLKQHLYQVLAKSNDYSTSVQFFLLESCNALQQHIQMEFLMVDGDTKDKKVITLERGTQRLRIQFITSYIEMLRAVVNSKSSQYDTIKKFYKSCFHPCLSDILCADTDWTRCLLCLGFHALPEFLDHTHQGRNDNVIDMGVCMDYEFVKRTCSRDNRQSHAANEHQHSSTVSTSFPRGSMHQPLLIIQWSHYILSSNLRLIFRINDELQRNFESFENNDVEICEALELLNRSWKCLVLSTNGNGEKGTAESHGAIAFDESRYNIGSMRRIFSSPEFLNEFVKENVSHISRSTRSLVFSLLAFSAECEKHERRMVLKYLLGLMFLMQVLGFPSTRPVGVISRHELLFCGSGGREVIFAILDILSAFSSLQDSQMIQIDGFLNELLINVENGIFKSIVHRKDGLDHILNVTVFAFPKMPYDTLKKLIRDKVQLNDTSSLLTRQFVYGIYHGLAKVLLRKFYDYFKGNSTLSDCYHFRNELVKRFQILHQIFSQRHSVNCQHSSPYQSFGCSAWKIFEAADDLLCSKQRELDSALEHDAEAIPSFTIRKCIVMISDFGKALESQLVLKQKYDKTCTTHYCFPISSYYWPAKYSFEGESMGYIRPLCLLDGVSWGKQYALPGIKCLTLPNSELFLSVESASFYIRIKKVSGPIISLCVSELQLRVLQKFHREQRCYFAHEKIAQVLQVTSEYLHHIMRPLLINNILKCREFPKIDHASSCLVLQYYV